MALRRLRRKCLAWVSRPKLPTNTDGKFGRVAEGPVVAKIGAGAGLQATGKLKSQRGFGAKAVWRRHVTENVRD